MQFRHTIGHVHDLIVTDHFKCFTSPHSGNLVIVGPIGAAKRHAAEEIVGLRQVTVSAERREPPGVARPEGLRRCAIFWSGNLFADAPELAFLE